MSIELYINTWIARGMPKEIVMKNANTYKAKLPAYIADDSNYPDWSDKEDAQNHPEELTKAFWIAGIMLPFEYDNCSEVQK